MNIDELKLVYRDLLQPIFGAQFRIDDSNKDRDWIVIALNGEQEDFYFSLYGIDCVHLYWCNQCFIFDKHRVDLVSSDTYGEIVFEDDIDIERLPNLIVALILQLKDCTFITKKETVKGKTASGYDDIRDYTIIAHSKTKELKQPKFQLSNITIEYELQED